MKIRCAALVLAAIMVTTSFSAETLRELAAKRNFWVGAAVSSNALLPPNKRYQDTLARQFNLVVAENCLKFHNLRPARDSFYFDIADSLIKFAERNAMRVRGHTLVWHNSVPDWLKKGTFTRDQAIEILREHINTVVGRYKGKIWHWDVVNEAVGDDAKLRTTDSYWHQAIGADYIKLAFEMAHQADPNAVLYYNDYSAEGMSSKSNTVYNLVEGLKKNGVPIHGVGWQCHFDEGWKLADAHKKNLDRIAALGLEVSITEFDLRLKLPVTQQKLQTQATIYGDVITFCLANPAIKSFLAWGFTDKYSWVPNWFGGYGAALIYDTLYQPKPCYFSMQQALSLPTGTMDSKPKYSKIISAAPASSKPVNLQGAVCPKPVVQKGAASNILLKQ